MHHRRPGRPVRPPPGVGRLARTQRVRHHLPLRAHRPGLPALAGHPPRDLAALNDAWVTSFWSQHYSDWTQISTPRATQYLSNPGQLLDFRRFWSDTLLAAYTEQRDLLRAANPALTITTNYVLGDWVPVDHARWATEVDLVAVDHYPSPSTAAPRSRPRWSPTWPVVGPDTPPPAGTPARRRPAVRRHGC